MMIAWARCQHLGIVARKSTPLETQHVEICLVSYGGDGGKVFLFVVSLLGYRGGRGAGVCIV